MNNLLGIKTTVGAVISTKGGVGKTTTTANLAAYAAQVRNLRTLMIDGDTQPTLTSYYPLSYQAPNGLFELLSQGLTTDLISKTNIENLDVIVSNDALGQLSSLLLHAPDGRTRLRFLLPKLASNYDLVLIDTQGARGILLETAVLAADIAISPIPTEMLSAREFARGTVKLMRDLQPLGMQGLSVPPIFAFMNRMKHTADARQIAETVQSLFEQATDIGTLLETVIYELTAYREAATRRIPAHIHEPKRPTDRIAPSALETMEALFNELFIRVPNAINATREPLKVAVGARHEH